MDSALFLKLNGITKRYRKNDAIKDVSLKLENSSSYAIMGPSGSGKTTLLRIIAGLEMPDEGEIYMKGKLISKKGYIVPPHLRGLGVVFQTPALWPNMTVKENICFGLKGLHKEEDAEYVLYLTSEMEIEHLIYRFPEQLSGGEARRVSIARALAPKPEFLLMDEPLTNLDEELKTRLLRLIKKISVSTKTPLIFVTHDPKEAEEIGDKVLRIEGGVLIH